MSRYHAAIRWIAWAVLLASLLVLIRALPLADGVAAVRAWVAGLGVWGPLAFGFIYILVVVMMLPASLLTLAAGATFGLVVGTITVTLAANVGSALCLLIARYLARSRVEQLLRSRPRLAAVDRALRDGGWKLVALLRLSPAVPYNVLNYLLGVTSIGFWTCVLTSLMTMLPGTFLYVYLGYLAGSVTGPRGAKTFGEWTMLAVGLFATLAFTVYLTRLARQKLHEHAGDGESASAAGADDSTSGETPQDATAAAEGESPARSLLPLTAVALVLAVLGGVALFKPDLFNDLLRSLLRLDPSAV